MSETNSSVVTEGTDGADFLTGQPSQSDILRGLGGDDQLASDPQEAGTHDILDGGDGNDTLRAERGSSTEMIGGAGNDRIDIMMNTRKTSGTVKVDAGDGNDIIDASQVAPYQAVTGDLVEIDAGKGNDTITGSNMAETFVFNRGDGEDLVDLRGNSMEQDAAETDMIRFGEGISVDDLRMEQVDGAPGLRLVILSNGTDVGDRLLLPHELTDKLVFADGSEARLSSLMVHLIGTDRVDHLNVSRGSNTDVQARDGDDHITIMPNHAGGTGTVRVDGGAGNDRITVNPGPNGTGDLVELIGGKGDDIITGSDHAETFIFNRGDGEDRVDLMGSMAESDKTEKDQIRFGEGISQSDLHLARAEHSPEHTLTILKDGVDTGDRLIMMGPMMVEQLVFADGKTLSLSDLPMERTGTEGHDRMEGTSGADVLRGLGGDDHLDTTNPLPEAARGHDILDGGEGNDTLRAYAGTDTEMLGGAGNDTLEILNHSGRSTSTVIAEGGAGDDTLHAIAGFNTELRGGEGNDVINIRAMHTGGSDAVKGRVIADGGAGDDRIHVTPGGSSEGRIELRGGTGNDHIMGSDHAETFIFNRGDGEDRVDLMGSMAESDKTEKDQIRFGEGITQDDLRIEKQGPGLKLIIMDDGKDVGDSILMDGIATEQLLFADGTEARLSALSIRVSGTDGDDQLFGTPDAEVIDAGAGNDLIDVTTRPGGLDTLLGGAGNDRLIANGGSGATLKGGSGNDVFEVRESPADGRVVVEGGTGNDFIRGSGAGESFIFSRNDGVDWIDDSQGRPGVTDEIVFGEGIVAADLVFFANPFNQDLTVSVLNNGQFTGDMITIVGGAAGGPGEIEQFVFADSTVKQLSDLWSA